MKRTEAYLCLDCDEIYTLGAKTNAACPACGSRAKAPVAGWILSMELPQRPTPFIAPAIKPDTGAKLFRSFSEPTGKRS